MLCKRFEFPLRDVVSAGDYMMLLEFAVGYADIEIVNEASFIKYYHIDQLVGKLCARLYEDLTYDDCVTLCQMGTVIKGEFDAKYRYEPNHVFVGQFDHWSTNYPSGAFYERKYVNPASGLPPCCAYRPVHRPMRDVFHNKRERFVNVYWASKMRALMESPVYHQLLALWLSWISYQGYDVLPDASEAYPLSEMFMTRKDQKTFRWWHITEAAEAADAAGIAMPIGDEFVLYADVNVAIVGEKHPELGWQYHVDKKTFVLHWTECVKL